MTSNYFFDTYAIIEIINGSANYAKCISAGVILTKLNLFELYYTLLKLYGKERAAYYMAQYNQFAVDFDEEIIELAAELKNSNKRLSITDCIGYFVALKKGVKFLTGDKEFRSMQNVEFIK